MEISFENLPKAISLLREDVSELKRLFSLKNFENAPEPDQLLTIQQAGELLNLSVATLYGYTQRAEIPVCKRGKRLYFSRQHLIEWVKSSRKKTVDELQLEAESYLSKTKKVVL